MIVDTGPLVAALDADDADHERCLDLLQRDPGPLLVPAPVLTEVCWLLERERGSNAEAAFLDALAAGELQLVEVLSADLRRMADLVRRYADLPLGAVDASVVAVAERGPDRDAGPAAFLGRPPHARTCPRTASVRPARPGHQSARSARHDHGNFSSPARSAWP